MIETLKKLFKKKESKGFINTDKDYLKEGANSKYSEINAYKAIPVDKEKENYFSFSCRRISNKRKEDRD